jgi:hypothetical protein
MVYAGCEIRLQPDRLTEFCDGVLILALGGERKAKIVVGVGVFGCGAQSPGTPRWRRLGAADRKAHGQDCYKTRDHRTFNPNSFVRSIRSDSMSGIDRSFVSTEHRGAISEAR